MDEAEPRLRRALVAARGRELGRQATIDALAYGWQHWSKVKRMTNPVGYLYRVGIRAAKPHRPLPLLGTTPTHDDVWVEPGLAIGLQSLTESQRVAVTLHHCYGWTYQEIGDVLRIGTSTVRNHIDRAMRKLRARLGVAADA